MKNNPTKKLGEEEKKKGWEEKELGEVLDYEQPRKYIVNSKNYSSKYKTPVLTAGKTFILGNTNEKNNIFPTDKLPVIIFDDFTTAIQFVDFPFKVKSSAMKILHVKKDIANIRYLFHLMQTIKINHATHKRYWISEYSKIQIPLPPLSEQKKIVAKLESVLAKISEAKKLRVEVQKNTNNLLSAELHKIFEEGKKKGWEEKELGEVFTLNYGKGLARSERSENGKYIVYGANGKLGRSDKYLIEGNGIIIGRKGSAGEIINVLGKYWPTDVTYFVTEDKNYDINFVYYLFKFLNFPQYAAGVKPGINRNQIYKIKISLPSLTEQKKIVARLDKLSQKIEKIKKLQATTQNELTILEQSILSKAFKGQL